MGYPIPTASDLVTPHSLLQSTPTPPENGPPSPTVAGAHARRRFRNLRAPGEGPQVGGTAEAVARVDAGVQGGVDGGVGFWLHRCGAASRKTVV